MATDKFSKLKEGIAKFPERGTLSFVANGVIPMWSPVVLVAPGSGETLPRVATTTTTNDQAVIGVAVGGNADVAGTGNAAAAAGDVVDVAIIGTGSMTKVKVDGAADNIAIGELLITDATAGQAESENSVTAGQERHTLGKACQTSTVNGDTILCILMGGGA